ncbi:hypothetical protein CFC21_044213 [Triticum aestivum]|uniref:Uncharacterized protein n=2 Tax=Triticum aestivum TaxID=4565 RepID=A0A9R1FPV0_WHEAT|nr:hypothetical protein CFC21_044213 [Triticum aestivum]CDM86397.1 unnamed protein product [Triticum aestivum]
MAEMVSSAIVAEAVSRIFSALAASSKVKDKWDGEVAGGGLERLEMACINMEVALKTSDNCKKILEHEEAKQVKRQSSFHGRVAHATKAFISSFVGRDNDPCYTDAAWAVQRFERLADIAAEFMRFVQLGGTPRHNLFFDPLIRHIYAGQTLMYEVFSPRGQYRHFTIQPMGFEERGLEALLSFIYEDYKQPKNSFRLGVMLRLSESTNIIGTAVKCLRLVTPHFKSTADVIIKEITNSLRKISRVAHMEHWNSVHTTLTRWFRPDPLCCQGYDSCHDNSESSSRNGGQITR